MTSPPDWTKRADALGRAQAHYLWVLIVVGVFSLALETGAAAAGTPPADPKDPIFGLTLSRRAISSAAPGVLFLVILVVVGSFKAAKTAASAIHPQRKPELPEHLDLAPNAIDLGAYTTVDSPLLLRRVLLTSYPLVISLFYVEAVWLLWKSAYQAATSGAIWQWSLVVFAALTGLLAAVRLVWFWGAKIRHLQAK